MNLPDNLDAEQARIVTLTLAALTKLDKLRIDPFPGADEEEAEERCLNCIREQMDEVEDEEDFAQLIRALVDAWEARA